jgi:hypothetical protein
MVKQIAAFTFVVVCISIAASARSESAVRIVKTGTGYELQRDGKPYFIQGVGGDTRLDLVKPIGGNSVRTWGGDNQTEMLDTCQKLGLSVTAGIWLGQPRQGFHYEDQAAVQRQKESAVAFVHRYKNHPAVLIWGLGNEMEGDGQDPLIWQAIDDAAKAIKQEDPNHPVMTVIAEIGEAGVKVKQFMKYCPHVDVLGINSYAGLGSLPERMKAAGFTRPYIVTEFGPFGFWEVGSTAWKAPIEPSSTEKAQVYLKNYEHSISGQRGQCLGSYCFHWGQKQEATSTWFGMFLKSGERTESVETMQYLWTGHYPKVRCPRIVGFETSVAQKALPPASEQTADVQVEDATPQKRVVRWEVREESSDRKSGGDREQEPPIVENCIVEVAGTHLRFRTPSAPGAYRLFLYIYDNQGNAATANVPFLVR